MATAKNINGNKFQSPSILKRFKYFVGKKPDLILGEANFSQVGKPNLKGNIIGSIKAGKEKIFKIQL